MTKKKSVTASLKNGKPAKSLPADPAPDISSRNESGTAKIQIQQHSRPDVPGIKDLIWVRAGDLEKNPLNWRKHPREQTEALQSSLQENGWAGALLFNATTNRLIDGHARRDLNPEQIVPVLVGEWSMLQEQKLLATLDPIAALAKSDKEVLTSLLSSIETETKLLLDSFDRQEKEGGIVDRVLSDSISNSSLSANGIATLLGVPQLLPATSGRTDPDDVPAPPDKAITQPGDLWILGNHRLLCGDSSKPEDVDRLLDGATIHLVNTDPPYNVKVEPRSNNAIAAGNSSFANPSKHQERHPEKAKATHKKMRAKDRPIENDSVADEAFNELLAAWFGNLARVLAPGRGFYIWGGYANCANYPLVLKATGLYFSQAIIWVKEHPVMNRKDFMGNHEWCFYGWREGAAHVFLGPNNAVDVWSVKKVNPQSMVHLTEKPVELAVRAIQYSSREGENVLDLFGGSGSTLIACEQTNRKAFLMELDPPYCDVIINRWEQFTGKKAKRVSKK